MSRKLVSILTTVVALNCIVVGSAIVWPNIASSTSGQVGMTAPAPRDTMQAVPAKADFDRTFTSVTPRRDDAPARLTRADFDHVFASVTATRRDNTPPNRERLRNAGWKRILGQG